MSYTTIINIWPGEKIEEGTELRNSHGAAPIVWNAMNKRYLHGRDHGWLSSDMRNIWDLWGITAVPLHQRAVMGMTFDHVIVLREDYGRAAKDIRQFLKDFPETYTGVNHWPVIAEMYEGNPDVPAIGIWQTSISENPYEGEWDEKEEKEGEPQWELFWSLYEHLGQESKEAMTE